MCWFYNLFSVEILDDNKEAATLLSEVVHREAADITLSEMQDNETEIPDTDVGIWIDPIGNYGTLERQIS